MFVLIQNGQVARYPYSVAQFRAEFVNVSLPEEPSLAQLEEAGLYSVAQTSAPSVSVTQVAVHHVALIDGVWTQQWEVVDRYATQAEADAALAIALVDAKAAKNNEINAARLQANRSEFAYDGKQFACDELSRGDIDGVNGYVALMGDLPPSWPGGWKAVDNTYLPIATVDDWKSFYTAMVAAGNANFAHAQALKTTLAAATTVAEVAAIVW